jgi:hypothetical protein
LQTNGNENDDLVSTIFQQHQDQPSLNFASPVALPSGCGKLNQLLTQLFENASQHQSQQLQQPQQQEYQTQLQPQQMPHLEPQQWPQLQPKQQWHPHPQPESQGQSQSQFGSSSQPNSLLQDLVSEETVPPACFVSPNREMSERIKEQFALPAITDGTIQVLFARCELIMDIDISLVEEGDPYEPISPFYRIS